MFVPFFRRKPQRRSGFDWLTQGQSLTAKAVALSTLYGRAPWAAPGGAG